MRSLFWQNYVFNNAFSNFLEKSVWNVPKDAAKQRPILSFSVMTESRAYWRGEEQSKAWPESAAVLHIFEAMCFCSLLPEFPNSAQKV